MNSTARGQQGPRLVTDKDEPELLVRVPERAADILAERLPEDQVAGLLPRASTIVLAGDANSGKTFLALDIAVSIALGREVAGRRVRQGSVLYVAAEGRSGLPRRLRALAQKYPDLPAAPLRLLRQAINLREAAADLLIRVRDIEQDVGDLGLLVLDTLSQTLFDDENSPAMTAYIRTAGWLASEIGCPVLVLHHLGKDASRGMRGHSSLRGNIDVAIRLAVDPDGNRIASTDPTAGGKSRDDEPVTVGFRLRPMAVGRSPDGAEVTSCTVEYQSADLIKPRKPVAGAAQRLLIQLAADLARAASRHREDGTPLISRADLDAAWAAAKRATRHVKQAAPSYLNRPLGDLVANGHLMCDGSDLWFPR